MEEHLDCEISVDAQGEVESDVLLQESSIPENPEISLSEENENETESLQQTNGDGTEKVNLQSEKKRLVRLPLARIKNIMKADPDCTLTSSEAVFLVTKATELFLEYVGKETVKHTQTAKRKTVLKRDVDAAIDSVPHLCFLEGALE